MFTSAFGDSLSGDLVIFPLFTFHKEEQDFECLGSGFFITRTGCFITAKHLIQRRDGSLLSSMYGIQSLPDETRISRAVKNFMFVENSDLAIGILGVNVDAIELTPPLVPTLILSNQKIEIGEIIRTFSFPSPKKENVTKTRTMLRYRGQWAEGKVIEYYPNGLAKIKSPCYQTNMLTPGGASGGPVFKGDFVVGINSTGFDVPEGEDPLSFFTPISYLEKMIIKTETREYSVREWIILAGGRFDG